MTAAKYEKSRKISLPLEDALFLTRSFSGSLVFLGSERNLFVFAAACMKRKPKHFKSLQTSVPA